jgi:hypothetical protein
MRRAIASTIAALAIGGAALVSQGCGASEGLSPSDVAQAASATAQAKGSKVAFSGGGTADGETFRITGDGVLDNAGRRGDFTFIFSSGAERFEMQQVFLGTTFYIRLPEDLSKELDGRRWAKIDLAKVTEGLGIDLDSLGGFGSSDPSEQLDMLRSVSDAEKVGTEEVRGVETTHAKGTIDLHKYPELVPASKRAAARRAVDKLIEQSPGAKLPFEVWYDDENLIRRMKQQVDVPGGDPLDFTMEFYDYGTPIAVKAPPASETKDITDLAAEAGKKQGG